jgi:hypothetical protein
MPRRAVGGGQGAGGSEGAGDWGLGAGDCAHRFTSRISHFPFSETACCLLPTFLYLIALFFLLYPNGPVFQKRAVIQRRVANTRVLRAFSLPWYTFIIPRPYPERVSLVPHISFVKINFIAIEQ